MAGSFVTLFQWRLNSVLLQENEILLAVKDQILSLVNKLDEVGSFLGHPVFWTLHAREMAESFLKLFEPYLKKKGNDEMMSLIRQLDEVTRVAGDVERIRACCQTWVSELRVMLHEAEDYVDDFIIKVYGQTGQDRKESIAEFGSELENINSRVSEIMNRRPRLGASPILEEIQQFLKSRFAFDEDDEETALASCMLNYINLPYDLKLSLLFCCAFRVYHRITKGALVRVLVAAGLIQEKPGELMEDKAQENIEKLMDLGMLQYCCTTDCFGVRSPYYELSLSVMNAEDFFISSANSDSIIPPTARHVSIHGAENTIPNMNSLLHSLFVSAKYGLSKPSPDCWETVLYNAKLMRVLDLENTQLKSLPDEVGKLVHLRYLVVSDFKITELPESISNLRSLQTLDIWSGNEFELSNGVLNLAQLRHLKMSRNVNGEVRVPRGISRLSNLQTLEGIYAGGGIAKELGNMTQLKSLEVRCVSDDHADELYASVMNLTGLRNLSLILDSFSRSIDLDNKEDSIFLFLESFSPPPLLETLELVGRLTQMPLWLGSMENLTRLCMACTHLSENPTTILQFLPNLKSLLLRDAYKGKRMEREFFRAGGFPKLEYLEIISYVLVEWTEIDKGALPCLKELHFNGCWRLMGLPEGLQHVATLQKLTLKDVHGDLTRRLNPNGGSQNYKIKHIPLVESYALSCGWTVWKT
ncbi:disease resistance protein RPM1-like isoform X2 [Vitis riparia]|uniref:disease resistance protein RPM1-like isoform X2 n=1 Tax=Vitis riparia TaxID=96939 RepID=UPI00155A378D|nr:disease resistance protein RPM1-like isoform X2 [Vitis riparia]